MHEYELDDKTLQKAQLEQHKIFQNFPTSNTLAAPKAPPLPASTNPKDSPLLGPNDSDNDCPETIFDTQTGNTFLDNNKSLAQVHICKKLLPTHSPLRQRHSDLQSQVSEAGGFFRLPSFRKCKCSKANNTSI